MAACPVHHCVHLEILLIDRNLIPSAIAFCATGTIMANAFDTLETS
jgi:hypothetical protein